MGREENQFRVWLWLIHCEVLDKHFFPWASAFSYKMSSQIDWPKSTIQVLTTLVPLS